LIISQSRKIAANSLFPVKIFRFRAESSDFEITFKNSVYFSLLAGNSAAGMGSRMAAGFLTLDYLYPSNLLFGGGVWTL
jgi:hypothetical protein